jgi:hypothetical protein
MKHLLSILVVTGLLLGTACTDSSRETKKAKEDADAKLRADAAKKEMETLPSTFSTPDYYKKNQPAKTQPTAPKTTEPEKK